MGTFNRQRTCADRACAGTNTYQTPQQQTYTKTFAGSCQNHTCTKNSTITGPQGQTTTVNSNADRVGPGTYTGTTTITTPQGQTRTGTFNRTPNR